LVRGRPGPEFRPSEVARLGYPAGIVATMLRWKQRLRGDLQAGALRTAAGPRQTQRFEVRLIHNPLGLSELEMLVETDDVAHTGAP